MQPLPSLSVIEFPGVLKDAKDPTKAIQALGGEDTIRAACSIPFTDPNLTLTLNLRQGSNTSKSNINPETPVQRRNLFLLKITTTKHKVKQKVKQNQTEATKYITTTKATLIGQISSVIQFRCLADFQYHPFHNSTTREQFQNICNGTQPLITPNRLANLSEQKLIASTLHNLFVNEDQNGPHLPREEMIARFRPPRFARTVPEHGTTDFWFRQHCFVQNDNEEPGRMILIPGRPLGEDRRSATNRLKHLHHRVPPNVETVPSAPMELSVSIRSRGRDEYLTLFSLLQEVFQKRPIWIRRALYEGIPPELRKSFKRVIARLAYSFQGTGPFYQAWIRYGYDPRKDPSSRKYQVIDIRCTDPTMLAVALKHAENCNAREAHVVKDGFTMPTSFTLSELPLKKNSFVQVCDITLPEVRKVCEEEPLNKTFDMKTGFFSKKGHDRLLLTIKETLRKLTNEVSTKRKDIIQPENNIIPRGIRKKKVVLKDVIKPELSSIRYRKSSVNNESVDTIMKSTNDDDLNTLSPSNEIDSDQNIDEELDERSEHLRTNQIDSLSKTKSIDKQDEATDTQNNREEDIQSNEIDMDTTTRNWKSSDANNIQNDSQKETQVLCEDDEQHRVPFEIDCTTPAETHDDDMGEMIEGEYEILGDDDEFDEFSDDIDDE